MKKILLFMTLAIVSLASCKKSDETLLKNTWSLNSINVKFYENNVLKSEETENYTNASITFKDDGSYTTIIDGDTENGTWVYVDGKVTLSSSGSAVTGNIESISSSKCTLIFDLPDGTDKYVQTLNMTR
jgi:hypothetical protein